MYTIFNTPGPNFSDSHAIAIVKNLYDLKVSTIKSLPSDRDQNILLYQDDDHAYILKISHPAETFSVLDMQHKAIQHIYINNKNIKLPKEIKNIEGDYISKFTHLEIEYFVRLVEYIPGSLMKDLPHHNKSFIKMLGEFLGNISSAFEGFHYENSFRRFPWDISQTDFIYDNICNIDSKDKQIIVEQILNDCENKINGLKHDLPKAIIHNDANDHNVIINDNNIPYGIIDFGDIIKTYRVCEPAICIAYLLLNKDDPVQITSDFLNAYQTVYPIKKMEIDVIIYLVCLRLCISVTMAAYRKKIFPENQYIRVTEDQAWDFLKRTKQIDLEYYSDQIINRVIS